MLDILAMSMCILIMLDVWGILVVYEVSIFDCSFKPFQGCFGHFRGFGVFWSF